MQGDLEIETGDSLANKFMGDLHFNTDGTPVLILGHHVLYGKVLALDKPFVFLKKSKTSVAIKSDINDDEDESIVCDDEDTKEKVPELKTTTSYIVQAVIRRKLLFNKRPRPIVYIETKSRN